MKKQISDMNQNQIMRVGIVGAGWIAEKAAITLQGMNDCEAYAIASRSLEKAITIVLSDGLLASVQSSAACVGDNTGVIAGPGGNIIIDNINNPQTITLNGPDRQYVRTLRVPQQITGYEYQFEACRQALADGLLEPREMPHRETLYIMQLMDDLRAKWGVRYPMD